MFFSILRFNNIGCVQIKRNLEAILEIVFLKLGRPLAFDFSRSFIREIQLLYVILAYQIEVENF